MRLSTTIVSLEVPAAVSLARSRLSYSQPGTNRSGKLRLSLVVAVALALTPAALMAHPAGVQTAATDVSAAKKKLKKPKAPKEEYLKAAPGTGPSGPRT